jgi:transglutaminase-like putative cysteine protease
MARTTLCIVTAALLAIVAVTTITTRRCVLGDEVRRPTGPNTWTVAMVVQGTATGPARLITAAPLELERQQILDECFESKELTFKPPQGRQPERRQVVWSGPAGPFRAACRFHVLVDPTSHNGRRSGTAYAVPQAGEYLEAIAGADDSRVSRQARDLVAGLDAGHGPRDVAEALYKFVSFEVRNEPHFDGPSGTVTECLDARRGDRLAKARLLVALLRNRGIPARLVSGVALGKGAEQRPHCWVEAFADAHWLSMCPSHGCFGRVPPTYLVLGFGDKPLARGRNVKDLDCAFLIERGAEEVPADASVWRRLFLHLSLVQLPAADRRLVELLLLLPVAALIICVCRNLVGLASFGMFAPALIGLAFHDLHSWPGILVFVVILLIGWLLRRVLDYYHLLQVPRVALMLTLIMIVLIATIVASHRLGAPVGRYVSLFPVVILTGMVERFWTLEIEDSTTASFKTLLQTLFIAGVIAFVLGRQVVVQLLFRYPETLGLIMAAQLLIGRYTGYRLTELFRFRDLLRPPRRVGYTIALEP